MRTSVALTDEGVVKMADAAVAHAVANCWGVTVAIGVSGVKSERDAAVARAGIVALGTG
ncbi:hypothetical protein [Paraburkholderia caballeronis]|uniref:hypothetical protein n=1 Tax=Paraburkholderia caballeronis TaxID=416943 RepID=UPI0010DB542C|nr:hypothetical protein [Paraburkholderia caballeronis]TDV09482.1 hypothetical protein C7408_11564 [Paraburkholderia caballeronis]TDV13753.1 hypothetical protein C7406_11664 [Paraburkholderia caballeronis]TDV22935.1 hypothetical protein C7404_11564 [Paraburkholderia caballeronis]